MKYILNKRQFLMLEQVDSPLDPKQIILFKKLNQEKSKGKKRKELYDYMQNVMKYLSIPNSEARLNFEIYLANYRKDGQYEKITSDDFIDPKELKGKTTTNVNADQYAKALLPFKGSNLTGQWKQDWKGVKYYVVTSYGWYPIYIYKDNKWYEVSKRYSSSTGRQMGHVNPRRYNEGLKTEMYWATPEEMEKLERGWTHEDFMKNKIAKFEEKGKELVSKRKRSAFGWSDAVQDYAGFTIKFKITKIEREGDKGKIYVDIYGVQKRNYDKTPIDYLNDETTISKEAVERRIMGKIANEIKDYMGKTLLWWGNDYNPEDHIISFEFNHIRDKNLDKKPKENGEN